MSGTQLYRMKHLDCTNDDGSGGWCPAKGGCRCSCLCGPGGSGFPSEYEEISLVCDGLVVDSKKYPDLVVPTWDSPVIQSMNGGTLENPQIYVGDRNTYGECTDPCATCTGMSHPHSLKCTDSVNPDLKPV